MKWLCRGTGLVLAGMLLGGGLTYAAFGYHAVHADDGWHVVPSGAATPTDCVADVRGWTAADWAEHPHVASALMNAGKGDLVLRTTADGFLDRVMNRK